MSVTEESKGEWQRQINGIRNGDLGACVELCHGISKRWGWWPEGGRDFGECIALIHSKLGVAFDGERKSQIGGHLNHRPMAEVKLADALIIIFDLCGGFDIELRKVEPSNFPHPTFGCHLSHCHYHISEAYDAYWYVGAHTSSDALSNAVAEIMNAAVLRNYDVHGAIIEKFSYIQQWADKKA